MAQATPAGTRIPRARAVRLANDLRRRLERRQLRMARVLRRFFRQQAARVVARYALLEGVELKQAGPRDVFPGSEEDVLLERITHPFVLDQTLDSANLAAELTGTPPLLRESPELTRLMAEAGTRIVRINEQTLEAVQEALRLGAERGYTAYQIANGVPGDGYRGIRAVVEETYRGRADTIARTELGTSSQNAAHDRYGRGNVVEVDILDGDECGWLYHDDPDLANGSRRSLADARAHPLAHPNCLRVSVPVIA